MDIIKKYKNRKLYSMNRNSYINLTQLLEIARQEKIVVLDSAERNITTKMIKQAIRKVYQQDLLTTRESPMNFSYADTSEIHRLLNGEE